MVVRDDIIREDGAKWESESRKSSSMIRFDTFYDNVQQIYSRFLSQMYSKSDLVLNKYLSVL